MHKFQMNDDKKRLELAILGSVYDLVQFSYDPSERPDFIMRAPGTPNQFGVEITEHFQTESHARGVRVSKYVGRLLEGKPHLHRDDVEALRTAQVSIQDKDGKLVQAGVPAVISEVAPLEKYVTSLQECVLGKERSAHSYAREDLTHSNLVVLDHGGRLKIGDGSSLYRSLGSNGFNDRVLDSVFREIFLITEVEDQRIVYFPLKQLFAMSDVYMLFRALDTYDNVGFPSNVDDGLRLFAAWYGQKGRTVSIVHSNGAPVEVLFGNCGFTHSPDSFCVRDYKDAILPQGSSPTLTPAESEFLRGFEPELDRFRRSHVFQFACAYDVLRDPPGRGWTAIDKSE